MDDTSSSTGSGGPLKWYAVSCGWIMTCRDTVSRVTTPGADRATEGGLFLHVGLQNGLLVRSEVDRISGQLADSRTRLLGTKPPKLFAASVRGTRCMLALSSRPWLGYNDQGRFNMSPLSYEALDFAA
ncbi:Splicing factor 3B subunit 3, partial [Tetrabaena socialis]